jgi:uncharacterized membrane protein YphA (DoxX/SURF4 family)
MGFAAKFETVYNRSKQNQWMRYFTVWCRVMLALGFLPSGFVKIMGERFTDLSVNHPMGQYLEALHHTGYYYTSIGILQVTAAVLLLIPRTATLGALIYFPIILNICLLSLAVCFDGSMLTAPLMVIANAYLLCWDYDKLKWILARKPKDAQTNVKPSYMFPILFFGVVILTVVCVGLMAVTAYTIKPRNTLLDCRSDCSDAGNPEACVTFCDCIHTEGKTYDQCSDAYKNALNEK